MHVPPTTFWPAAFIVLTLPVALAFNLLFLSVWLLRLSPKVVLPILVTFLAWGYYERGVAFNSDAAEEAINARDQNGVQVLSYNVRIFNTYAHLQDNDLSSSKNMIRWIAQNPADIFCLQEFYNDKKSPVYNSVSKIGRQQNKYTFLSTSLVNAIGAEFGLAIFSKYPIVNRGVISFGKLTQNHAMFADVILDTDTVRVYNFHFQSMSIEEKEIVQSYKNQDNFKKQGRNLMLRFKKGFVKRSDQVNILMDHVEQCPYPVILCGDLNDLPYSYTYQQLNKQYLNAFTERGWGIGATYNGKLPFVRIDNQFCSKKFEVLNFNLIDSIAYSDHFPIMATYRLVKP